MKRHTFLFPAALVAVAALSACGKPEPTPVSEPTPQVWPQKQISRIVQRVGTLDYLTYDFTWREGLLASIGCTLYDGTTLGGIDLAYDGTRLQTITPFGPDSLRLPDGAMHYHYGSDGLLQSQHFILPLRTSQDPCQQHYDDAVPCRLTYAYNAEGKVDHVVATRSLPDGSSRSETYLFDWTGGNVTAISLQTDGTTRPLLSNLSYDTMPNPMRFPLGVETMGLGLTMILEGVFGYCATFLPYAFCWCENNMTSLLAGTGQCSFTYDADGYITSKTVGSGSSATTYLFFYR